MTNNMKLVKSPYEAGKWECICHKDGECFVGISADKLEAMARCFAKLQWFYSA